jgi:N-methylhydantoinase B/oxoprolinase/acetone carboxylase alpha subunit
MSNADIDPAELEMLWARLRSASNEQAATLVRTAFSSVVRDLADYACAIFDQDGRLIAQSDSNTPGLCCSMGRMLAYMLRKYPPATLDPGDVLVSNNPWEATGHHNDITLYTPVFWSGGIIGYTASAAHQIDIGGRRTDLESRDNFEEGLRIPVSKLYRCGEPNEDVFAFIRENVRFPETVVGDIRAQVAANHVAAKRLASIAAGLGTLDLKRVTDEIIGRSRELMRNNIRRLPPGRYASSQRIPNVYGQTVDIAVAVEIRDDEVTVDFSGTSAQAPIAINCTLAYTTSYALFALYTVLSLKVPINEGILSCLRVKAPEGSVLNATFPAPVFARSLVGNLVPELIYRALAPILPEQVMAASGASPVWLQNFFGVGPDGRRFSALNAVSGGMGARHETDGLSCLFFPVNIMNLPVELMEADIPIVIEKRALLADSAGHGKARGGFGQEFAFRVLDGERGPRGGIDFAVRGGRAYPGWGLFDGEGVPESKIELNGRAVPLDWKGAHLEADDRLVFRSPGGGGYGNPRERSADAVREDVRSGLISAPVAREVYGYGGD